MLNVNFKKSIKETNRRTCHGLDVSSRQFFLQNKKEIRIKNCPIA